MIKENGLFCICSVFCQISCKNIQDILYQLSKLFCVQHNDVPICLSGTILISLNKNKNIQNLNVFFYSCNKSKKKKILICIIRIEKNLILTLNSQVVEL